MRLLSIIALALFATAEIDAINQKRMTQYLRRQLESHALGLDSSGMELLEQMEKANPVPEDAPVEGAATEAGAEVDGEVRKNIFTSHS